MSGTGNFLTIDEIFESLNIEDDKILKSLENFRDEHCDMCFHYKDIANMIEFRDENMSKEDYEKLLDEIMNIGIMHTDYWREE